MTKSVIVIVSKAYGKLESRLWLQSDIKSPTKVEVLQGLCLDNFVV